MHLSVSLKSTPAAAGEIDRVLVATFALPATLQISKLQGCIRRMEILKENANAISSQDQAAAVSSGAPFAAQQLPNTRQPLPNIESHQFPGNAAAVSSGAPFAAQQLLNTRQPLPSPHQLFEFQTAQQLPHIRQQLPGIEFPFNIASPSTRNVGISKHAKCQGAKCQGGLKYVVGSNGEPPVMADIHCEFVDMAVEVLQSECHGSRITAQTLIDKWNSDHAQAWRSKPRPQGSRAGKPASGQATHFFSNRIFTMTDLLNIANGRSPRPVPHATPRHDLDDSDSARGSRPRCNARGGDGRGAGTGFGSGGRGGGGRGGGGGGGGGHGGGGDEGESEIVGSVGTPLTVSEPSAVA